MIAGTYTPVCYVYLSGYWRWSIITIQWALVVAGLVLKLFLSQGTSLFFHLHLFVHGMDWDSAYKKAFNNHASHCRILPYRRRIIFTFGAILYAIKKPVFRSGFGFHEIFHLSVLLGWLFHYLLVYTALSWCMGAFRWQYYFILCRKCSQRRIVWSEIL